MTRLPAAAAEPRHRRGGAGGVARGQWTVTPLRIVMDAEAYAEADTKVYVKVKALSRKRPCEASVDKLAAYVGLAPSTMEKSLGRLSRPAPTDGVTELTRRQRSHKGTGTGRTTERTCRRLGDDERYVSAPVLAADTLRGILHRLYLLLRYTTFVEKRQLTLAEMAWVLRHHSGKRKGKPLAEAVVTKLLEELDGLGWITLDKRAGYRGRHLVEVHDHPIHPVGRPQTTPDPEGGAAPDPEGGALAYKEDQALTDLENTPPTAVLGNRRRRPTPASARERETAVDTFGRRVGLDLTPAAWRAVRQALDPVREQLAGLTGWEWERVVADVLAQLGNGQPPARLAERLHRRYTPMRPLGPGYEQWLATQDVRPEERIRSFSRWLIGAGLVRRGCHDPRCESGVIWGTDPDDHEAGHDCRTCTYTQEAGHTRAQHEPETDEHPRQTPARHAHTPPQRPGPPPPAPSPPHAPDTPPSAPQGRIGPPPGTGGWRSLVARERPHAAAQAYRHRWTGDHAHHLHPDTA